MKRTTKGGLARKRIFLDTNVILDFLLEREPFYRYGNKLGLSSPVLKQLRFV